MQSTTRNTIGAKITDQVVLSCIDHICQCFSATVESLAPILDASEDILCFLAAQAELLLHLMRSAYKSLSLHAFVLVLKTLGSGLKVLSGLRSSVEGVSTTMRLLLMLLLSTLEFTCLSSCLGGATGMESVEDVAKISNTTISLLPILCNCNTTEHCTLSLTTMDFILKSFLMPDTWFPIIQNRLSLQNVVLKLQDNKSLASFPIILKFFLTLARVRGGAEMLANSGFFSSLRVLFAESFDGRLFSPINSEGGFSNSSDKIEKPGCIWGLGLSVVTAIIQSLGDSSTCIDIVDNVIHYFFSEKAYMIFYHLNAPDFPSDDPDKKRPRAQRTQTSLAALKETEHTLMLMCVLAKHWNSWVKAMKEMDSELREKSIHLLAFISRGTQRHGEPAIRGAPLLCPPTLKEDFDCCKKESVIKSRRGWFALSPLGCVSKQKFSAVSTALTIKDQATKNTDPVSQTYFSDTIALQIYKIAFLLLKFLCLHAEGAAKRAEELGFVDLARFPELPMPEILHGLQVGWCYLFIY
jgi:nuclear pore complex protein Nup188